VAFDSGSVVGFDSGFGGFDGGFNGFDSGFDGFDSRFDSRFIERFSGGRRMTSGPGFIVRRRV